jgi:hypothetical protein
MLNGQRSCKPPRLAGGHLEGTSSSTPLARLSVCGAIMTRQFDQRAIERAAVILRVAQRYSGDELDDALKGARRAIGYCFKEARAEANASRALIEAIDAARSIARNRA